MKPSQAKLAAALAILFALPLDAAEDRWAHRNDLIVPPQIVPSTKVDLGARERFALKNGLSVLVVPRRNVPSVDVTLAIRTGLDPVERSGLAQFTASMLRKGTHRRSAEAISEAIDFVGASLEVNAEEAGTLIDCHARSKDLSLCLDLLSDLARQAQFPESEMDEVRQQLLASVEGAKDSPRQLAGEHAHNLFFGDDDPRGRSVSKRSIEKIERQALLDWYHTWYGPGGALLAVAGDVDPQQAHVLVEHHFGSWKREPAPTLERRTLPKSDRMTVRIVDKPDATQATIAIVGPGVAHAAADFHAVRIMNWVLGGGGFSSRLMKVVRAEGGKTYSASSHFEAGRDPGPFFVNTFTRTEETAATLNLVFGELAKMGKNGPTEEEIKQAKANLIGGYGLRLETATDLARALLRADLDGLPVDAVARTPSELANVTLVAAKQAAETYLTPRALVVVGPAKQLLPLFRKAGIVVDEVIDFQLPVSAGERRELELALQKKRGQGSPSEHASGQKLLAMAIEAKGGRQALAAVRSLKLSGKGSMRVGNDTLPMRVVEYQIPGQALRQEISVGSGTVIQGLFSGRAFAKEGSKTVVLPSAQAAELQRELWRDPNFVLLHATESGTILKSAPTGDSTPTAETAAFDLLDLVASDGDWTRLWLDRHTHLITKLCYREDDKEVTEEFSDYRKEGGIWWPHKFSHTNAAGEQVDLRYDVVEINPKLPDGLFTP